MATPSEYWNGLDRRWQLAAIFGVVLLLIAAGLTAWLYSRPTYVTLVSGRSGDQAASAIAELENLGVPYQVDHGTGDIKVAASDKERIRALLAKNGVSLKPPPGFSLFDNGDFGMTEFTEHINYERALEGELTRTVMALDEVQFARIHIVLPQSSLFRDDRQTPKASVLIAIKPGQNLSPDEVAGIQRLIAAAVPGLQPAQVSIHNDEGVDLTDGMSADAPDPLAVTRQVGAEAAVEDHLTLKADEALAQLFPDGGFHVSVSARLEDSQTTSTREEVLPTGKGSGAVSTISTSTPGANSVDMLRKAAAGDKDAASDGPKPPTEFDVQYQVGHLTVHSKRGPGSVAQLSVGVLIPDPSAAHMTTAQVRDLLGASLGLDFDRGDRLAVYVATPVEPPAMSGAALKRPSAGSTKADDTTRTLLEQNVFDGLSAEDLLVLSMALLCVGLILAAWRMGFRSHRVYPLDEQEREVLLTQIRSWLKA